MKKAIMSFLTIWMLVCANLIGLVMIGPEGGLKVSAVTIIVDDDGTPGVDCNYTTIQQAIDNATAGDTVYVKNGTYYENVVVNKTINLTGEGRENTIIYGNGTGNVINISADWVNVTGFSASGSGSIWSDAGIKANGVANFHLANNNLSSNNSIGIQFQGNYNTIENNICNSNNFAGIWMSQSNYNVIENNTCENNGQGFQLGGNFNIIKKNIFRFNTGYGLFLNGGFNNSIYNNSLSFNGHGISFYGTDTNYNNSIFNNTVISNTYGISMTKAYQNSFIDNNISMNKVIGINMRFSRYNEFYNNTMYENSIYIQGNELRHWNTHNIPLNNTVNGKPVRYWKNVNGGIVPIDTGEIILANSTNIIIRNQNLSNNSAGIVIGFSNNNRIYNNTLISSTMDSILISSYSNNNSVRNNKFSRVFRGIQLYYYSNNNTVENNIFDNSVNNQATGDTGIYIIQSNFQMIRNNSVNAFRFNEMQLQESNNNYIEKNQFLNSWYKGVFLYDSNNNTIIDNNCSRNLHDQIYLYHSNDNSIFNNTISFNNDKGIHFINSTHNTITSNLISNNQNGGIYLDNSSENIIYHNNLIDNVIQAYDNMHNNTWNDTYPSGGNYWSDYGGVDNFQGPNQDLPGSDGIGDTNYSIDSDSIDNYPLMTPTGNYIFLYPGWNLISIPRIQSISNLGSVLSTISGSYDAVQWYNANDPLGPWKHNQTSKPSYLNDLNDIEHKIGFWIHITEPDGVLFEYFGTQITVNQSITLQKGWNMVGYPSLTRYNRTDALNNLTFDSEIDAIWTFNTQNQRWKQMEETDTFEPGRGYWIHATTECEWEVPL